MSEPPLEEGERAGVGLPRPGSVPLTADEFSRSLTEAVFTDSVLLSFVEAKASVEERLAVDVQVDTPELARLPWELLRVPNTRATRYFAKDRVYSFARVTEMPTREIASIASKPGVLALAFADGKRPLDFTQEKKALDELHAAGVIALTWLSAESATYETLRKMLSTKAYQFFHFAGHGGFDQQGVSGTIELLDGVVPAKDLIPLFSASGIQFVFLNSCKGATSAPWNAFAGTAQQLLGAGVSTVLAMQHSIPDDTAGTFAREFYGQIAGGATVADAVTEARIAVGGPGARSYVWATPVLYLNARDGRLVGRATVSEASVPSPDGLDVYRQIVAAIDRLLCLPNWNARSETLVQYRMQPEFSEGMQDASAKIARQIWPGRFPALEEAIKAVESRAKDFLHHFFRRAELRGGLWRENVRFRQSTRASVRDEGERQSQIWRGGYIDRLVNLCHALNLYAEQVRKTVDGSYRSGGEHFVLYDDEGVIDSRRMHSYLPDGYRDVTPTNSDLPDGERDVTPRRFSVMNYRAVAVAVAVWALMFYRWRGVLGALEFLALGGVLVAALVALLWKRCGRWPLALRVVGVAGMMICAMALPCWVATKTLRVIPGSHGVEYRLFSMWVRHTLTSRAAGALVGVVRIPHDCFRCSDPRYELWERDGYIGCLAVVRDREGGGVRAREIPATRVRLRNAEWARRHRAETAQMYRDDLVPDQAWKEHEDRLADHCEADTLVMTARPVMMDLDEVDSEEFAAWLDGRRHELASGSLDDGQRIVKDIQSDRAIVHVWESCQMSPPSADPQPLYRERRSVGADRCGLFRPSVWLDGERYRACPGRESEPIAYVTWEGAREFCRSRGGRLPSESEWVVAARGPDGRQCPWGDVCEPFRDVVAQAYVGLLPNQTLHQTGSGGGDVSVFGMRNMFGNMREWVDGEPVPGPPYDQHPRLRRRPTRGSAWLLQKYWFYAPNSEYEDYGSCSLGFRCAYDAGGGR